MCCDWMGTGQSWVSSHVPKYVPILPSEFKGESRPPAGMNERHGVGHVLVRCIGAGYFYYGAFMHSTDREVLYLPMYTYPTWVSVN